MVDLLKIAHEKQFPHFTVLVKMALQEKQGGMACSLCRLAKQ